MVCPLVFLDRLHVMEPRIVARLVGYVGVAKNPPVAFADEVHLAVENSIWSARLKKLCRSHVIYTLGATRRICNFIER